MYKIIIIEDQILLLDLIKKDLENNFQVVYTTNDSKYMLELCNEYNPDIILTDICTKNNNALMYAKKVKDIYKDKIKIIAMTAFPEINFIKLAKNNNLDGFIYKNIKSNELIETINKCMNGIKVFPDNTEKENICIERLTSKEFEILTLFCSSYSRDEIAKILNISNSTLKNHITSILKKTDYDNIPKLVYYCLKNNYIIPNK